MALPFVHQVAEPVSTAPIGPKSVTFPVRDREITLTAMGGDKETGGRLLDWGEMHLLAGQELLSAYQMARRARKKDSPIYRATLRQMIEADIARVCMATGQDVAWVASLSPDERSEIIARQNQLNGINAHLSAFSVGQVKASYAQQSP